MGWGASRVWRRRERARRGRPVLDPSYPDGAPRKLLDVSRIAALGWQARTPLNEGLHKTYDWFCRSPWAESP